jgi:predicted DNA-binding transcriptional regulator AlpA
LRHDCVSLHPITTTKEISHRVRSRRLRPLISYSWYPQGRAIVSAADRATTTLRRGLRREEAATVSPSTFDNLIEDGTMPKPFKIRTCTMWDIRDIDLAFDALKNDQPNPLDAKWR